MSKKNQGVRAKPIANPGSARWAATSGSSRSHAVFRIRG